MKALRVFFTKNVIKNAAGLHPSYHRTPHAEDFPETTDPQEAYRKLLQSYGSVQDSKEQFKILTGEMILVAPGQFITINSHTYVELDREKAVIESERMTERPLLSGTDLFAAQSRKPEPIYRPRGKQ